MHQPGRLHRSQHVSVVATLILLAGLMGLTGCVTIPTESTTQVVGADELSAHVHFLAQPALKGRKPKTRGSKLARRYIRTRFESYGLIPWGNAKRYAQSFGLGTNMIGVLPGSDPNLAGEFVIVAAHYDHVGKTDKGMCLGASDNASGVAALLEIAESLSLRPERPRRSVCFAAFDCEETFLLGAFAFTCREDFDKSRIAGVVNIDMLGRDAFAVLDHSLFMTGTQRYPDLRQQIQSHVPAGLTLLPVGTEIAGPRGDHIAFETLDRPVLFFSCGPHEDYHHPSDTPEKINYDCAQDSVAVIARAVEALADSDHRYHPDVSPDGDVEELKAVKRCLVQIRAGHEAMGWTETQAQSLDPVIEHVDRLLDAKLYTRQDRLQLLRTAAQHLVPLMVWPDSPTDSNDPNQPALSDSEIILQTLCTEHRPVFIRAARLLIKDLLSRRIDFLLGRAIHHTVIVMDVPDHLIFVQPVEPARYRLSFLVLTFAFGAHINNPSGIGIQVNYAVVPSEFTGTTDELTDYSLLLCHNPSPQTWLTVLRHVTGAPAETTCEQALGSRLAEDHWASEEAWILDCACSNNPRLRYMALANLPKVMGPKAEPILLGVLADPNATSMDRQGVVVSLKADSSATMLIAVAALLSDQTQIKHPQQKYYERLTRPDTPFEGYPLLPLMVKGLQAWIDKEGQTPWTMADLAQQKLQATARHRFDKDPATARQWIEANWPPKSK